MIDLRLRLNKFETNSEVKKKSRGLGIKNDLFKKISGSFVKAAISGNVPRISARELLANLHDENTQGKISKLIGKQKTHWAIEYIDRVLLSAFLSYAEPHLPEEMVDRVNSLKKISDLRFPSEWFPEARQMQR
jgi:ATP-dependent RNA helicase SUPV3L1/SUV3